jgi:Asp-tRNA(Asn)/Glu-tRNA(Gln) amidotransferase A subunit family amidase
MIMGVFLRVFAFDSAVMARMLCCAAGLPFGLQLVAAPGQDLALLQLAKQYEAARKADVTTRPSVLATI